MRAQAVVQQLADHGSIVVRADGPYGAVQKPEWSSYDSIVMIAGGIGVPFLLAGVKAHESGTGSVESCLLYGRKMSERPPPLAFSPRMTGAPNALLSNPHLRI